MVLRVGGNQIELYDDALSIELLGGIPTLTGCGLIPLVVLLMLTPVWIWRKRRAAATG